MNIYYYPQKGLANALNSIDKTLLSYLAERGHKVVNQALLLNPPTIATTIFEDNLSALKQSNFVLSLTNAESVSFGFLLGRALLKNEIPVLWFQTKDEQINDSFIRGCTFSKFYSKRYSEVNDIKKELTVFKV